MIPLSVIAWLILWAAVGFVAGEQRGRTSAAILLCVFLGPIGLIILLVGPNPRSDEKETEHARLLRRHVAETRQLREIQARSVVPPAPFTISPGMLRVGRAGRDLGALTVDQVRDQLRAGTLSTEDTFYDVACQEWLPLRVCPQVDRCSGSATGLQVHEGRAGSPPRS